MTRVRSVKIYAVLLACVIASACALHNPPSAGIPKTALQWTIVYNAAVAKTNNAVEQAVETVQASGAITAAQARPIIVGCGKVAQTSESVRAITSKGSEASWNVDGPAIRAILTAAQLKLPASTNATIDLAVSAVNSAIILLTQGVK